MSTQQQDYLKSPNEADLLPALLDEIKQNFEIITTNIAKASFERYPVLLAQQHIRETEALIQKLHEVLKERNLSGFPADIGETTSIAAKQKQIIDHLKQSWMQSQSTANVISKAFADVNLKKLT